MKNPCSISQCWFVFTNRRVYVFLIMFLFIALQSSAQLLVQNNLTPQQLVQQVLVGSGVTVLNVEYTGANIAQGSFSNGSSTNLGIDEGVVLSSGSIFDIPNPASVFASTNNGQPGDPLLTQLANNNTNDAAVLEFDFIPQSDTLTFKYVFGSEEYPEYVCSGYNDVFGFFVSGPNPSNPLNPYNNMNIAEIPGSMPPLPVAINTVNNGSPGGSYPASGCESLAYASLYIDNQQIGGTTIVYDGFTRVLTATLIVVPCEQYHIKLSVGDAGDGAYDSGVFLEANSFSSPGVATSISFLNSSSFFGNAVEGCNDAMITFDVGEPRSEDFIIEIAEILGSATQGVDYILFPSTDTLIIPAGELTVDLVISPYADNEVEGTEDVKFIFEYEEACNSSLDTTTINILDNTMGVGGIISDSIYCISGSPDTLEGTPPGGVFSGPGMDSTVFDPAVAGVGTHTINYQHYFIDVTIFGTDTICSNETDVEIQVIDGPGAWAGPDDAVQEGEDYALTDATASYYDDVAWNSSGTGTFDDPSITNPTYSPSFQDISNGSVVLSLTANAQSPCPGDTTDSMVLTIASGTTAIAGEDAMICEGDSYPLNGNGLFFQSLEWTTSGDGVFTSDTIEDPIYIPGAGDISSGSVTLTLTVFGSSSDADDMVLTIVPAAVANAGGNASIDEGEAYTTNGTASNYSACEWITYGDGSFDDPGILNAVYTPGNMDNLSGQAELLLIAYGEGPCGNDTSIMQLNIISGTSANAGQDMTICANDPATLSGSAVFYSSIRWDSPGDGQFDDPSLTGPVYYPGPQDIQDSTVTLTITAFGSDTVSSSMTLFIHPLPEAPVSVMSSRQDFCSGSIQDIELIAQGGSGEALQWYEGVCGMDQIGSGTPLTIPAPLQTTTYTVWWQNMCGVSTCEEVTVNVVENLDVQVQLEASENPVESGQTVEFTATPQNGGSNPLYIWYVDGQEVQSGPDNTYITASLSDGQIVHVEMRSSEQCVINDPARDEILMGVKFKPSLLAPTAFSPNGDNLNDVFKLVGPVDEIARVKLRIFDRWGQMVFESRDLDGGWDGTLDGKKAPAGVYVWVVDYTIKSSAAAEEPETRQEKGNVVLVR